MNDEVKMAKAVLNKSKKIFKQRRTPLNLQKIKECEEKYDQVVDKAKDEWVSSLCKKIDRSSNPKEKWRSFKQLTSYQIEDSSDILPLVDSNGLVVFENKDKTSILQQNFFGGKHLENIAFDKAFKREIEDELQNFKSTAVESSEEVFLSRSIMYNEVEAVL